MCGLGGVARADGRDVEVDTLARMAGALRHRGPDGYGFYADGGVGMAHVRLSIVDVEGGAQPMTDAAGSIVVAFNGEIFNFRALRKRLEGLGYRFRTQSDTEVLVHGWHAWGPDLLPYLNGDFALAVHDTRSRRLHLVRDRFGVRPLFLAEHEGGLYFASEVKGILAAGLPARPDLLGIDETFLFWGPRAPRTPFAGVQQLAPGTMATWHEGRVSTTRWYTPPFGESAAVEPAHAVEDLAVLLEDSIRLRLQADVPVGAYLSGGLDSSLVSALAHAGGARLSTFGLHFAAADLDERDAQRVTAAAIGTHHHGCLADTAALRAALPAVVAACETPLVRSGPVPMYLLARFVRSQGIKSVLTGEGADEAFLGYDLFKEAAVRRFCARRPESRLRPRLLDRLYPWLAAGARSDLWRRSFLPPDDPRDPLFSHRLRLRAGSWARDFYAPAMREQVHREDPVDALRASLPVGLGALDDDMRADWLEFELLLAPYLLAAQGDRVGMAWAVEARFPYLDHRVVEMALRLPVRSKRHGLKDKAILRRVAARVLPPSITGRAKQPYRGPAVRDLLPGPDDARGELLSPGAIRDTGYFDADAVAGLLRRARARASGGAREDQALLGIYTTQVWHHACMGNQRTDRMSLPVERGDVRLGATLVATVP